MKYSLDFLAWVNRCMFRNDFMRDLQKLGVPSYIAFGLSSGERLDVLSIYQENIQSAEDKEAIEKYLAYMLTKWERM